MSCFLLKQLIWALLPLAWSLIALLFSFVHIEINGVYIAYPEIITATLIILSLLFFKILEHACKHYNATFFGYRIPLPPWWLFVAITASALLVQVIGRGPITSPTFNLLLFSICAPAIIEELTARVLFVNYRMGRSRFILLNAISSFAAIFIHVSFFQNPILFYHYAFRSVNHFIFNFMLGIVAYKTRRIEVCIIIHILSEVILNVLPLFFPELIRSIPILYFGKYFFIFLIIIGCSYQFITDKKNKGSFK